MSRRTKKQKQIAALRRRLSALESAPAFPPKVAEKAPLLPAADRPVRLVPLPAAPKDRENIYFYPPVFVRRDLIRTMLISGLMLLLIGATYYWIIFR